jgi:hypothetical protein
MVRKILTVKILGKVKMRDPKEIQKSISSGPDENKTLTVSKILGIATYSVC